MLKPHSKKIALFLFALSTSLYSAQSSHALCNSHLATMKGISDTITFGSGECLASAGQWSKYSVKLTRCIVDSTNHLNTVANDTVLNARKKLGALINLQAPACRSNGVTFAGYSTTNPDYYIEQLQTNLVPIPEPIDITKSPQYNKLKKMSQDMQAFIDKNKDSGDPAAVKKIIKEKKRVDSQLARLEKSDSERALKSADKAIAKSEGIFEEAKETNDNFVEEYPAVLAELEKVEEEIDTFLDANANMPRNVAYEPGFTENKEVQQAQSNLTKTLRESVYSAANEASLRTELANAMASGADERTIKQLENAIISEMAKPTQAQHELNIRNSLSSLVGTISASNIKTAQAKGVYTALEGILGTSGDLSASGDLINAELKKLSGLRSSASNALKTSYKKLKGYKTNRDLTRMAEGTAIAQKILEETKFSLSDYYQARDMAVTTIDTYGNIETLGASLTASNTSQYYAVQNDDGTVAYSKSDKEGNSQYSITDADGNTNYVGAGADGSQYLYNKNSDGITQYYIVDSDGNFHQMQSQIKYDRRSYEKVTSLDTMTLAEAEAAARAYLLSHPDLASSKSYKLRRVLDSSERLSTARRENDRYALRYVNNLMSQIDYLEFYDQYSGQLDDRYRSTMGSISVDPETGTVGIGRTRTKYGDVGGTLNSGLGLDADAISELLAVAKDSVNIDGVSVTAGSRSTRVGRSNIGTVTTISSDKFSNMLGGLSLDEFLKQGAEPGTSKNYNLSEQVGALQGLVGENTSLAGEAVKIKQASGSSSGYGSLLAAEMIAREYLAANPDADPRAISRLEKTLAKSEGLNESKRTSDRYAKSYANSILKMVQYTDVALFNLEADRSDRISIRDTPVINFTGVDGVAISLDLTEGTASVDGVGTLDIKNGISNAGIALNSLTNNLTITDTKATQEFSAIVEETIAEANAGTTGYGLGTDTTGTQLVAVGGQLGVIALSDVTTDSSLDEAVNAAISSAYQNRTGEQAAGYETVDYLGDGIFVNQAIVETTPEVLTGAILEIDYFDPAEGEQYGRGPDGDYIRDLETNQLYRVNLDGTQDYIVRKVREVPEYDLSQATQYNTNPASGETYYTDNETGISFSVDADGVQTEMNCQASTNPYGC